MNAGTNNIVRGKNVLTNVKTNSEKGEKVFSRNKSSISRSDFSERETKTFIRM